VGCDGHGMMWRKAKNTTINRRWWWQDVGCDGHGVRWQGAKKYNNQSVVAVARHAVWLPRREVARSKKITINRWWWWWRWQDMRCDSQPRREVPRSQKVATINWPGAKKIKQSTGHWQEVRCAGHGMRWPGAKKNQSATGRKCAVLATACGWPGAKKYNNQPAVVVTECCAGHGVRWTGAKK